MEERTKLHENLASTSDLSMNNVHTDYFLSFIPTKLKPPSGEKAKKNKRCTSALILTCIIPKQIWLPFVSPHNV